MSRKKLYTNRKFVEKQKGIDTRTLGKQKRKEALIANDQRVVSSAMIKAKLNQRLIDKKDHATFKAKLKEVRKTLSDNSSFRTDIEIDELLFDFSIETSNGDKVFIDLAESGSISSAKKMICERNNYDYQNIPFELLKDEAAIKLNSFLNNYC